MRPSKPLFALIAVAMAAGLWWMFSDSGRPALQEEPAATSTEGERAAVEWDEQGVRELSQPEEADPAQANAPTQSAQETKELRGGIRVLRASGEAAIGVRVVLGDYLAGSDGAEARQHVWLLSDAEGIVRWSAADLEQLLAFKNPERRYYAAAHFPYTGPAQVIAPLDVESSSTILPELLLRPAGSIEVQLRTTDGSATDSPKTLQLVRNPWRADVVKERNQLPFAAPGAYDALGTARDSTVHFDWIGVGVQGTIVPASGLGPTVWSQGPTFDGDTERLEVVVLEDHDVKPEWTFDLVDPEGRAMQFEEMPRWTLQVVRQGEVWHQVTGMVRRTEGGRSQIQFDQVPPILEGDRADLRFFTSAIRWTPLNATPWMNPGAADLGLLALQPLAVQFSGQVVNAEGKGIPDMTVLVTGLEDSLDPRFTGTDENGRFELRGELSDKEFELTVWENAFYKEKKIRVRMPSLELNIALESRFPPDER